jgi:2-keto-4-pentenoate hydratase
MEAQADEAVAAFRAQLDRWRRILGQGAKRVGWKLAFGIDSIEAVQGDVPMLGHLTSRTELPNQGSFQGGGATELGFDTELAIQVARRVEPEEEDRKLAAAVGAVAVALELVDLDAPQDDLVRVIENNVMHQAFVLGKPSPPRITGELTAAALVDGREVERATKTPDLVAGIRHAARLLGSVGEALVPGDWILTGSLTQAPCGRRTTVSASIIGLDTVTMHIA